MLWMDPVLSQSICLPFCHIFSLFSVSSHSQRSANWTFEKNVVSCHNQRYILYYGYQGNKKSKWTQTTSTTRCTSTIYILGKCKPWCTWKIYTKKRRRRGEGQKPEPKGKTKRKRKCYNWETLSMREHPSRLITNNMQPQKRHASRPAKGPRTYNWNIPGFGLKFWIGMLPAGQLPLGKSGLGMP